MKKMGRLHRPFYRICAMDIRRPRGGKVLEELGTYDPMVRETDARALLKAERVQYWLSVGALPSDKVAVLIKKYGVNGTHLKQQEEARARLSLPRVVGPAPEPPPELAAARKKGGEGEAPAVPAEGALADPAPAVVEATGG
jgi:small subunit ribosomal protein S16